MASKSQVHVHMFHGPITQPSKRLPCGVALMKTVRSRTGNSYIQPLKVYPYQQLKSALQRLILRDKFLDICEHWRTRIVPPGHLYDIYEGQTWQGFLSNNDFFQSRYNLCLTIKVDWFQPFSHTRKLIICRYLHALNIVFITEYSVGAIYLVIQNLPRSVRYKKQNIILVGLIPGPKEPKFTINSFLYPLVEELKELWFGAMFECPYHPLKNVCVRAALTCCASDIPATRKLCGFVGHSAKLGCSKCSKEFSISSNKRDYSGFDSGSWPPRCLLVHKTQVSNHLHADNRQQQKDIEAEFGIRYSVLLELPYWNPIKFSVIDVMHNIYLGTAKHVKKVWVEKNCITKTHFKEIERIVSKISTPRSVGRLPIKIASGFSGFTADQWKNWITVFSPVALKHILSSADYHCWLLFVQACFLLGNRMISAQAIDEIHQYLTLFCKHFEELYGAGAYTPNMHLHLHLKDCLKDYGPAHSFWVYGFERFNGILGRYQTNNHSIEVQLMRKFLCEAQIQSLEPPSEAAGIFNVFDDSTVISSVHDADIRNLQTLAEYCNIRSDYSMIDSNNSSFTSQVSRYFAQT